LQVKQIETKKHKSMRTVRENELVKTVSITIERKNDFFAKRSKILLDIDLKIILLVRQNNFVENNGQRCKKF